MSSNTTTFHLKNYLQRSLISSSDIKAHPFHGGLCTWESCPIVQGLLDNLAIIIYQKVIEFFAVKFNHLGVDGKGQVPPLARNSLMGNAFWISTLQGENQLSLSGAIHLSESNVIPEVIAHEYTHGVIHSSFVRLNGEGEAAALSESIADVFGVAFKHWYLGRECDWIVSNRDMSLQINAKWFELILNIQKAGLSLLNQDLTGFDSHHRCMIPSRAFYLAVKYAKTTSYGGVAKVWYGSLSYLVPNESFSGFAMKTVLVAAKTFPYLTNFIAHAWLTLGVIQIVSPAEQQVTYQMEDEEKTS
jgi:Thermolysin metallopeptidase, alpha-helical domain